MGLEIQDRLVMMDGEHNTNMKLREFETTSVSRDGDEGAYRTQNASLEIVLS